MTLAPGQRPDETFWSGASFVSPLLCRVCFQPECELSAGGSRPRPGVAASRLEPGEKEDRGYGEWAIHPDEARFLLHRGYALVDGERQPVRFLHNEAHATQVGVGR